MPKQILYFSEYYDSSGTRLESIETEQIPIELRAGDEVIVNGVNYRIQRVEREHREGPSNLFLNLYKYYL